MVEMWVCYRENDYFLAQLLSCFTLIFFFNLAHTPLCVLLICAEYSWAYNGKCRIRQFKIFSRFIKLHQLCQNQTWCNWYLQISCKLVIKSRDNQLALWQLQQTSYHQAGASDGNAFWYRCKDCSRLIATCVSLRGSNTGFWYVSIE